MSRARLTFEELRSRLSLDPNGELSLKTQPMILMPRHFFIYIMERVEAVAGVEAFRSIYRKAGFDGAVTFCRRYREVHRCTPRETVEGYLEEMSFRGWGRFQIVKLDEANGRIEVMLHNSALRHARLRGPRHEVWVGAMEGALSFLLESQGRPAFLQGNEVALQPGDPVEASRIHVQPAEKLKGEAQ